MVMVTNYLYNGKNKQSWKRARRVWQWLYVLYMMESPYNQERLLKDLSQTSFNFVLETTRIFESCRDLNRQDGTCGEIFLHNSLAPQVVEQRYANLYSLRDFIDSQRIFFFDISMLTLSCLNLPRKIPVAQFCTFQSRLPLSSGRLESSELQYSNRDKINAKTNVLIASQESSDLR